MDNIYVERTGHGSLELLFFFFTASQRVLASDRPTPCCFSEGERYVTVCVFFFFFFFGGGLALLTRANG